MVRIFCNVCEKDITDKIPIIVSSKFQICKECLDKAIEIKRRLLQDDKDNEV